MFKSRPGVAQLAVGLMIGAGIMVAAAAIITKPVWPQLFGQKKAEPAKAPVMTQAEIQKQLDDINAKIAKNFLPDYSGVLPPMGLGQTDCAKLPEKLSEIDKAFESFINGLAQSASSVFDGLKVCQDIERPSHNCDREWRDVQERYNAAFIFAGLAPGETAVYQQYLDAKAKYEACVKQKNAYTKCNTENSGLIIKVGQEYQTATLDAMAEYNEDKADYNQKEKECRAQKLAQTPGTTPPAPAPQPTPTNPPSSIPPGSCPLYKVSKGQTGNQVCGAAGKTCVGYPKGTAGCTCYHPNALVTSNFDGSSSGVFCSGKEGGICGKETGTCHVCPACNINMDCSYVVGGLEAEAFVECK